MYVCACVCVCASLYLRTGCCVCVGLPIPDQGWCMRRAKPVWGPESWVRRVVCTGGQCLCATGVHRSVCGTVCTGGQCVTVCEDRRCVRGGCVRVQG